MSIRQATKGDLVELEKLSVQFILESGYPFKIDKEKMRTFIWSFLTNEHAVVYIMTDVFDTPVGMVAGELVSPYYSKDLIAQEIVWYVLPQYRGGVSSLKLLKTYEQWAVDNGVKYIQVSNIEALKGDLTSNLYERLGYVKRESAFLKEIK